MPQNFFDPMQSMNALAGGAQIGGAIRDKQTQNALSPMVAKGDYKGAMEYAGSRGDLGQVDAMRTQYEAQIAKMTAEEKAAGLARVEGIARVAMGGMDIPEDQLGNYVASNQAALAEYGVPPEQIAQWSQPGALNRQALQKFVTDATPFAEMLKTQVVSQGSRVYQGGRMIAENPKDAPPPKYETVTLKDGEYEYIPGQPETMRKLGDSAVKTPLVQVNTGDTPTAKNLSPFQKKQDEIYAQTLSDWNTGGASDAAKGIDQMKAVSERLRSGEDLTGFLMGMTPDFVARGINPQAVDTRELAEEVVQRNLRIILGAQFTAKEGERLIARAYNKGLSEEMNAERIDRLVQAMDGRAQQMKSLNEYTTRYGTSAGWDGSLATVDDLLDAMDGKGGGRNAPTKGQASARFPDQSAPAPAGVDPQDWQYLTPEEQAAFQ
jgi:hypothetical protein